MPVLCVQAPFEQVREDDVVGFELHLGGLALHAGAVLRPVAESRGGGLRTQLQSRQQAAVDEQVGIAADGRGEVAIGGRSQPEVADISGLVHRAGLGSEHLLHERGLAPVLGRVPVHPLGGLTGDTPDVLRGGAHRVEDRCGQAQAGQDIEQTIEPERVGKVVDPIDGGYVLPLEE